MQMFIKRERAFISNLTSFISLKAHLKMIFFWCGNRNEYKAQENVRKLLSPATT
jgi:hypothetical protein